jgi:hypothetical protein
MPSTKIENKIPGMPDNLGDVHAPVEDTDVPGSLKFLVILMVIMLVGLGVVIGLALTRFPWLLSV